MLVDFDKHKDELFTDVYYKIANAKTRYVLVWGGTGSSKSHSAHQNELINLLDSKHDILVMRKHSAHIRDSCYETFKVIAKDFGIYDLFTWTYSGDNRQIKNNKTGRRIFFRGIDDPESLKSIVNVQRVLIEEINQFTEDDFAEVNRRVRGMEGIQIVGLFNPVSEMHWLKKYFYDDPKIQADVTAIHSTYKDNPFLTKDDVKQIEERYDNRPNDYRIYVLGQWGKADVKSAWAYNFNFEKHVKPCNFRIDQRPYLVWDFNISPFVVLAAHIFRDEKGHHIHVFDELVLDPGDVYSMCAKVKDTFPQKAIDQMIVGGDYTSNKREITDKENLSAWKIVARELNISMSRVQVIPNPQGKQIKDNMILFNSILARHPDIRFAPHMKLTINELLYTEADEDGRLLKKNRDKEEQRADAIDDIKYLVNTWLSDFLDNPKKYI